MDREYPSLGWLRVCKFATPSGAVAGFAVDINELKQREAALKEQIALSDALARQLRERADTDALTGTQSRRAFLECAAEEFQRMRQAYLEFLLLDPRRRLQTRPPDRHLPTTAPALDLALRLLFQIKCAFCERLVAVTPYRFRPTSEALPIVGEEGALAYGWLADVWQNLYPIVTVRSDRSAAG